MRLTLCPACAGKFKDKAQVTIHQIADKCQGGCRNRAMCLVWDVSVYNRGEVFMPDDVEVERKGGSNE